MSRSLHADHRTLRLSVASVAALCLSSGWARAQEPAPDNGIEEIVVTAQRREERLQDVPVAVSAFDNGQLEQARVNATTELGRITPGLNVVMGAYVPQITIRGIGTRGAGAGDEAVVPIYIDGVYQNFIPAGDMQFNNIERIEVLKGPQGALFGRNATGGALNIITRRPSAEPTAKFGLSYGRFDEWVAKGYVSGGAETVAADLAFVVNRDEGYTRDVLRDKRLNDVDYFSVRSKILITPNQRFEWGLGLGYTNNVDHSGVAYRPINGNTIARRFDPGVFLPDDRFEKAVSFAPYTKVRQYSGSVNATYKADSFTVTSLTSIQGNKLRNQTDSDASPLDIGRQVFTQISRNLYQEVYAASSGDGALQWIGGAVYFHDVSGLRPSRTFLKNLITGVMAETRLQPTLRTDSYAGYLQATYALTDDLKVSLGGRYTREEKDFDTFIGVTAPLHLTDSATFNKFTPNAIIQYQPNPRLNLYAKAGQAFKSGLFNANAATVAAAKAVRPETVTQYEVGLKADPLPWLRTNFAAYYTDYKDIQTNSRDPVTLASVLQNAGSASIYGLEGEFFARVSSRTNLRAGFSLIHGEYESFPGAQVIVPTTVGGVAVGGGTAIFIDGAGKELIRTPDVTLNVGGDHTVPLASGSLKLAANLSYTSKLYWDVLNSVSQPGAWLLSANARWTAPGGRIAITFWGENLFDETYPASVIISTAAHSEVIARPRTMGVELSYDF